jgi:hypothetical protein
MKKLEKQIRGKFLAIKIGKETPASSGIGKLINAMKDIDLPLHETLMAEYKTVLEKHKQA